MVLFNYQWEEAREEIVLDLDKKQTLLIQQDKIASLGQLTAGIAHEINNPINFVNGNALALTMDLKEVEPVFQKISQLEPKSNNPQEVNRLIDMTRQADVQYLFSEMKELISGIQQGSERITDIVNGLKIFTHQSDKIYKKENLKRSAGVRACPIG